MRRITIIFAILLAALSASGDAFAYRLSESIEFGLPAGEGIRFSLRNIHGSITVTGWDREELGVSANVRIRAASKDMARRIFDGVAIDFIEDEGWISIAAVLPRTRKYSLSGEGNTTIWVDYDIRLPASAGLEISSVTGDVEVSGVEGTFHLLSESGSISIRSAGGEGSLTTGNGDISCELGALAEGGTLLLRTGNGDITLGLPGDAGALLAARTKNGRVRTRLHLTDAERSGRGGIKGILGDGRGKIVVESASGDVTIGEIKTEVIR